MYYLFGARSHAKRSMNSAGGAPHFREEEILKEGMNHESMLASPIARGLTLNMWLLL